MRSNRSNRGNRVTICLTPTICFESDHFISFTKVSPCFSIRWLSLHRKMMFLSGETMLWARAAFCKSPRVKTSFIASKSEG